jgi:hypothetical protein
VKGISTDSGVVLLEPTTHLSPEKSIAYLIIQILMIILAKPKMRRQHKKNSQIMTTNNRWYQEAATRGIA